MKKIIIMFGILIITSISLLATSNPKATGDIVGRDLSISGLGWAGHVGIWDGRKVLEVLNKSTVIQKNSLYSFKNSSSYWGARYGKGSRHYRVISAGWNQRYYSPTYTTTSQYREGKWTKQWRWDSRQWKWVQKWVKQTAKFRCDTFVNYAYRKGSGVNLSPNYTLPRQVYNSMPHQR